MTKYNIYLGQKKLQSNLNKYRNPILNYFKSIYNDCFVPSFMNNKSDDLNRNKHAGAHIAVSSFTVQPNGFRNYNQIDYYYVTTSQVNIVNHWFFSIRKSVVENASSNNKFMFITPNSLFVCDRDFIIDCVNKTKDIKRQLNTINNNCFYLPLEDCETIPFDSSAYSGFYNKDQWKPQAIGFYQGKAAGNQFKLIFPGKAIMFNSVKECFKWINSEDVELTYTKSEKSLSRDIRKGSVTFVEGTAKVEHILDKSERVTFYETIVKRHILTDEELQNQKEWEEFQKKTIEELENKEKTSSQDVAKDKSETQNVSRVIIKTNSINLNLNNNNNRFNNNTGHPDGLPTIVLDNKYETWDSFSKSDEIWKLLKRRPKLKDYIDYKHNKLITREIV